MLPRKTAHLGTIGIPDQEKSEAFTLEDTEQSGSAHFEQHNWNKPVTEDGSVIQSASPETQGSERTRSRSSMPGSLPEAKTKTSYEMNVSVSKRSEPEQPMSTRVPSSPRMSHPEEDTYTVPQQSGSSGPRMIVQTASGRSSAQNAFLRLKSMGASIEHPEKLPGLPQPGDLGEYGYPSTKAAQKKQNNRYPGYKSYRMTRCNCCLSTTLFVLLLIIAIGSIIGAILLLQRHCQLITVMVILVSLILLLIIIIEWTRKWLWREPSDANIQARRKMQALATAGMGASQLGGGLPVLATTPGQLPNPSYAPMTADGEAAGGFLGYATQQRMYDIPKFVSAICLMVLYIIGALFLAGLIAASASKMDRCQNLAISGIAYAAILAILLCTRLVLCCVSEACRGLCLRASNKKDKNSVPMAAENQLHQFLPGMGGYWHSGGETTAGNGLPTSWLVNLASSSDPRQQLSMIRPMPLQYGNELAQ